MAIQYLGLDDVVKLMETLKDFTKTRELRQGNLHMSQETVNSSILNILNNIPEPLNLGIYNSTNELFANYPNGIHIGLGKYAYVKDNNSFKLYTFSDNNTTWIAPNSQTLNNSSIMNLYYNINGIEQFTNARYNTYLSSTTANLGYMKINPLGDFISTTGDTKIAYDANLNIQVNFNGNKYDGKILVQSGGTVTIQNYNSINLNIVQPTNNIPYVQSSPSGNATVTNFTYTPVDSSKTLNSKVLTFTDVIY